MEREFAFTPDDFDFIAKLVREKTGIVLGDHKQDMVYARLARRVRSLRLANIKAYYDLLQSEHATAEIGHFVNPLTTQANGFFRRREQFDHLRDAVLSTQKGTPIRLWSAGCSSGAEAYSMAMICLEAAADSRITATTIDRAITARAATGDYPISDLSSIPTEFQTRYVERSPHSAWLRMSGTLKELIDFMPLNLIDPWPFSTLFHAIFCRDVLRNLATEQQNHLIERFADSLTPGGFLYLGRQETIPPAMARLEPLGNAIYRKT